MGKSACCRSHDVKTTESHFPNHKVSVTFSSKQQKQDSVRSELNAMFQQQNKDFARCEPHGMYKENLDYARC